MERTGANMHVSPSLLNCPPPAHPLGHHRAEPIAPVLHSSFPPARPTRTVLSTLTHFPTCPTLFRCPVTAPPCPGAAYRPSPSACVQKHSSNRTLPPRQLVLSWHLFSQIVMTLGFHLKISSQSTQHLLNLNPSLFSLIHVFHLTGALL